MRMLDDEDSNDVEVTWSDQEKINQFSRLNTRQTEAEQELQLKRQEKEQVDEIYEEIEMLELNEDDEVDEDGLDDDDDLNQKKNENNEESGIAGGRSLPFKVGDAFVYVTLEKGLKLLDQEKERLEAEIALYEKEIAECEKGMKVLKVDLYAKFGSNINLERD